MANKCVFWCLLFFLLAGCGGDVGQEPAIPQAGITLKKGVIFNHSTHSESGCESCHQCGIGDGKISFISKDWAHITCKTCHTQVQRGPVNCKGCHVAPPAATKTVASAMVFVTQTGTAEFVVSGSGMGGIAGIQIDIAYDAAALAIPTVTGGPLLAGAMLASNTSAAGIVKIAAISTKPFAESGQIAVVNFATKTASVGFVSIKTIEIISATGEQQPVAVTVVSLNGTVPAPPIEYFPIITEVPLYQIPSSSTAIPVQSFSCN